MKKEQIYIVGGIAAVVLVIWLIIRQPNPLSVQTVAANPTGGGGPTAEPVASQNYNVQVPQLGPSAPLILLPNNAPQVQQPDGNGQYLFYNYPTQPKKKQVKKADTSCGCGSNSCETCGNNMRFPDGKGGSLAYSQQAQIANTPEETWNSGLFNAMSRGLLSPVTVLQYWQTEADRAAGGVPAGNNLTV